MILLNDENKQIFSEQVNDHIEKLNDLMGLTAGETIDDETVRKATLATKLLEGSTAMLGMACWSGTLELFRQLMEISVNTGRFWDEQLSQVVSEILETEEQVVAELLTGEVEEIDWERNFEGLTKEIEVLLGEVSAGSEVETPFNRVEPVFIEGSNVEHIDQPDGFSTLDRLIGSLYRVKDQFKEYIADQDQKDSVVRDLEHAFGESEFYIGLIGGILKHLGDTSRQFLSKVSSSTVLDGVEDFFNLHGEIRGWNAELETRSDDFSIERGAASTMADVLQSSIFDVCRMYEQEAGFVLTIKVDVMNEGSYLVAKISDNGPDFLCDSEIDCEDTVAYYKGLLSVRSLLERWRGLLWVEPGRGRNARFQFTLPHTTVITDYLLFNAAGRELAIPYHCIDGVVSVEANEVVEENGERHVMLDGVRVPVYRLDEIVPGEVAAGEDGDRIVIAGLAERRVGIFSRGPEQRVQGIRDQLTGGDWNSLTRYSLHLGEEEFPVLDVSLVLKKIGNLHGLDNVMEDSGSFAVVQNEEEVKEVPVPRV